ncbi:hypothetical protein FQA39_LY08291 [Lamprigera yunnana]|nr:hypothetical protein FQA39_LY08291 [Lamprigera yunnana]
MASRARRILRLAAEKQQSESFSSNANDNRKIDHSINDITDNVDEHHIKSRRFKIEQNASNSKVASKCSYDDIENLVEDEGSSLLWPPPHGEERQELTGAIYYLRQLLIKHDFIVESESSEISERSALIGRNMFKRFLDMYGNMTFTEEKVLFSNTEEEESTPGTSNQETRALKKIKIDEDIIYSGSDREDNVDGRNRIPCAVKIKAVELEDLHPKWSLATLQK